MEHCRRHLGFDVNKKQKNKKHSFRPSKETNSFEKISTRTWHWRKDLNECKNNFELSKVSFAFSCSFLWKTPSKNGKDKQIYKKTEDQQRPDSVHKYRTPRTWIACTGSHDVVFGTHQTQRSTISICTLLIGFVKHDTVFIQCVVFVTFARWAASFWCQFITVQTFVSLSTIAKDNAGRIGSPIGYLCY